MRCNQNQASQVLLESVSHLPSFAVRTNTFDHDYIVAIVTHFEPWIVVKFAPGWGLSRNQSNDLGELHETTVQSTLDSASGDTPGHSHDCRHMRSPL